MCLAFPSRHDRSVQIIPLNRSRFHSSSQLQFFTRSSSLLFSPTFFFSYFLGFHLSLEHWFESAIHFCSLKSINTLWICQGDGTVYWTSFVIGKFCMINKLTTEMCFDRHNPPVWSQLAYTGWWRHASIIVSLSLYNSNSHASRAHWFVKSLAWINFKPVFAFRRS